MAIISDDEPYLPVSDERDIIRRLESRGSLFRTRKLVPVMRLTSPLDGFEADEELLYGITVNCRPGKLMNKRQWRLYSHDQQKAQLLRIEAASRRGRKIDSLKLAFEVCPNLNQIHFHALYRMPASELHHLHDYYKRIMGTKVPETKPWRYLDIKVIHGDPENWIKYITKEESGNAAAIADYYSTHSL